MSRGLLIVFGAILMVTATLLVKKGLGPSEPILYPFRRAIRKSQAFWNYWPEMYKVFGYHRGDDWGAPQGEPILAGGDGVIVSARYDWEDDHSRGYGLRIYLYIPKINKTVLYAHLSALRATYGQHVQEGDVIGDVGSTGKSTAAHLHLSVWAGKVWFDTGLMVHEPTYKGALV